MPRIYIVAGSGKEREVIASYELTVEQFNNIASGNRATAKLEDDIRDSLGVAEEWEDLIRQGMKRVE